MLDGATGKILVAHAVHGPRQRERVVHGRSAGGVAALPGRRLMRDNAGCHRTDDGHGITQKTTPGELCAVEHQNSHLTPSRARKVSEV